MPTETSKSFRRFKGFYRLEEEAKQQLYDLLAGCKPEFSMLSEAAQAGAVQQLRPLAQRALLNALEGRTQDAEEQVGYDWEDALPRMQAGPLRPVPVTKTRQFLGQLTARIHLNQFCLNGV